MMTSSPAFFPLLLLFLLLLINVSTADTEMKSSTTPTTSSDTTKLHINSLDKTWRVRAKSALKEAEKSYHPDPLEVVNHLNSNVHKAVDEVEVVTANQTRRELRGKKKHKGKCVATNPIDQCWRCRPNWAKERKRLAECVLGFGRNTIGGVNGKFYVVTDGSDDDLMNPKPGTLRHAVTRREPLWIIFSRSMIIRLSEELIVTSYKTIDGRGHQIRVMNGAQITLQFVRHVIITNIHVQDINAGKGGMIRDSIDHYGMRDQSDGDGISIYGSSNVWVDHVSMANCLDGLIDAIYYSTAITISNCHFTKHLEVLLLGAHNGDDGDKIMQVTIAFNHFGRGLDQRMPRGRFGFFHIVNNDYTHWEMYAIGGSQDPTFISQGNRFNAPKVTDPEHNATEVTKREYTPESEWKSWLWKSEGDLLLNHAFFVESGDLETLLPYTTKELIEAKPGSFVGALTMDAGALECIEDKPC